MRIASLALALLAAAASAAETKPDFKVSAEELSREYSKDKEAWKKYSGKVVEVAGAFHTRRPGTDDVLLLGHLEGGFPNFISCTPDKETLEKHQRMYGLARGQKLTFRGVMSDSKFSPVLGKCE